MKLAKALNDKTMDIRLVDRLLGEGKISKAEFDKHITSLEDCEGQYEVVSQSKAATTEVTE